MAAGASIAATATRVCVVVLRGNVPLDGPRVPKGWDEVLTQASRLRCVDPLVAAVVAVPAGSFGAVYEFDAQAAAPRAWWGAQCARIFDILAAGDGLELLHGKRALFPCHGSSFHRGFGTLYFVIRCSSQSVSAIEPIQMTLRRAMRMKAGRF